MAGDEIEQLARELHALLEEAQGKLWLLRGRLEGCQSRMTENDADAMQQWLVAIWNQAHTCRAEAFEARRLIEARGTRFRPLLR